MASIKIKNVESFKSLSLAFYLVLYIRSPFYNSFIVSRLKFIISSPIMTASVYSIQYIPHMVGTKVKSHIKEPPSRYFGLILLRFE